MSTDQRSSSNVRRLTIVLALTGTYLAAEVVGGLVTGSLALLADAGHMLTDVAGLALALVAIKLGSRSPTSARTYGFYRIEILAALTNAVVLVGISIYILYEAYQRFRSPPEVQSTMMLAVAGVGLIVNLVGVFMLRESSDKSLNMKGAYFEVISDLLASVAVIGAAIIMMTTGWYLADPILSAGIGLFILPRTWSLMKEAVGVLLEGTPADVDIAAVRDAMLKVAGVEGVHDLHVWSLSSGINAMSAHVVTRDVAGVRVLEAVRARVLEGFKIQHATIQLEPVGFAESEQHV